MLPQLASLALVRWLLLLLLASAVELVGTEECFERGSPIRTHFDLTNVTKSDMNSTCILIPCHPQQNTELRLWNFFPPLLCHPAASADSTVPKLGSAFLCNVC